MPAAALLSLTQDFSTCLQISAPTSLQPSPTSNLSPPPLLHPYQHFLLPSTPRILAPERITSQPSTALSNLPIRNTGTMHIPNRSSALAPTINTTAPCSASAAQSAEGRVAAVRQAALPDARVKPCHTTLSRKLKPSALRPHVAAGERLTLWTTEHTYAAQRELDALPIHLQTSVFRQALAGLEPSTRESYGAGLMRFTVFCDANDIPEYMRMPTSTLLIAAFVAQFPGALTDSSVKNYLSGLQMWHVLNNAPWHSNDQLVKLTRRAVTKAGVALKRPP
ncbi:hypothetical protein HDZ31DRAFT_62708 [Schizophyllum fasciatum]